MLFDKLAFSSSVNWQVNTPWGVCEIHVFKSIDLAAWAFTCIIAGNLTMCPLGTICRETTSIWSETALLAPVAFSGQESSKFGSTLLSHSNEKRRSYQFSLGWVSDAAIVGNEPVDGPLLFHILLFYINNKILKNL